MAGIPFTHSPSPSMIPIPRESLYSAAATPSPSPTCLKKIESPIVAFERRSTFTNVPSCNIPIHKIHLRNVDSSNKGLIKTVRVAKFVSCCSPVFVQPEVCGMTKVPPLATKKHDDEEHPDAEPGECREFETKLRSAEPDAPDTAPMPSIKCSRTLCECHAILENARKKRLDNSQIAEQLFRHIASGGEVNTINPVTGNTFLFDVVGLDLEEVAHALCQHPRIKRDLSFHIFHIFYVLKKGESGLSDLLSLLNDETFIKTYRPSLHELIDAFLNIPVHTIDQPSAHRLVEVWAKSFISLDELLSCRLRKDLIEGEWVPSDKGKNMIDILFRSNVETIYQLRQRLHFVIAILNVLQNDFKFAELVEKAEMYHLFMEFAESISDHPLLETSVRARIDALRFICEKYHKSVPYNMSFTLTSLLDSAVDLPMPPLTNYASTEGALFFFLKYLGEYRKQLLSCGIKQYDALLMQMLSELTLAFEIESDSDAKEGAKKILERIKHIPSSDAPGSKIPPGFLPGCIMFYGGFLSSDLFRAGHAVVYVIERNRNGNFNFRLINTGDGAPKIGLTGKTMDIVYENLPQEMLTTEFLEMILKFNKKFGTVQKMDEIIGHIDDHFSQKGFSLKLDRVHKLQKKKTCVFKSMSSFIKYRLSNPKDKIGLQFKAFYSAHEQQNFRIIKEKYMGKPDEFLFMFSGFSAVQNLLGWFDAVEARIAKILEKRRAKADPRLFARPLTPRPERKE